jgi:CheY-like chemotaxis protein
VTRVVLVDDHDLFRAGVRAQLGDAIEIVGEAASVADAVQLIKELDPDVVLLDVHLGGVRSEDLLGRLRAQGIPVVLVTGSADVDELRGLADDVLTKPFQPTTLVDTARRLARVREP